MSSVHFSSQSVEWATPQGVFDALNAEFGFTLDACATEEHAKCENWLDANDMWSSLAIFWYGTIWCNPPYGRNLIHWVKKAWQTGNAGGLVVMLIPARTDTKWFHDYCLDENAEIRFIRGRLKFGGAKNNAPFPSMVVIFKRKEPSQ